MKFAHLADCHIGAWRDPKIRELSTEAFEKAVDNIISQKADFVLISGDLFHTSLPTIENLRRVVRKLKQLKKKSISVYITAGSHDYSPGGKTILDVLEEAELVTNVVNGRVEDSALILRFTTDEKTKAKITGMIGRKGMLEKRYYEALDKKSLEEEKGFKIFMFHTALTELKPKHLEKMDSSPISFLPEGFDYYAGGHVHIVESQSLPGYKNVVYPGPLFPANFYELEELEKGGYYLYEDGKLSYVPVKVKNVFKLSIDAHNRTPEEVIADLEQEIKNSEFYDTIVLLRVEGRLRGGRTTDLNFKEIFEKLYKKGAFFVMRNTSKLVSEEFEEIKITSANAEEIENDIIKEHLGQIKTYFSDDEQEMTKRLIKALSKEKAEGEKVYEYQEQVKKQINELLGI